MTRVEVLEAHVTGQSSESPGLLMRMDRVETIAKVLLALAGVGFFWKLVDAAIALGQRQVSP